MGDEDRARGHGDFPWGGKLKAIARLLLLGGAAGVVAATLSPWADVDGPLKLDLLGVGARPGGRTVAGIDTPAGPVLLGLGVLIVAASILNRLRKLVMFVGVLLVAAGAGLVYYVHNAVDIETRDADLKRLVARQVVDVRAQPGPYLLLGSGVVVLVGAAARRG